MEDGGRGGGDSITLTGCHTALSFPRRVTAWQDAGDVPSQGDPGMASGHPWGQRKQPRLPEP